MGLELSRVVQLSRAIARTMAVNTGVIWDWSYED
jgi:hypothetical protein